jgi:hypothetical protein
MHHATCERYGRSNARIMWAGLSSEGCVREQQGGKTPATWDWYRAHGMDPPEHQGSMPKEASSFRVSLAYFPNFPKKLN